MCAAHLGCHSDGVLELSPPVDERFVARLRIFNPDGSEAELSGNGVREAVLYLRREGWTDRDEFSIETAAGEVRPTITSPRTSTVKMGRARLRSPDFPSGGDDGRGEVIVNGREMAFQHVSIGNPQCAIRVAEGLEELDLAAIGPQIEHSELFPNRTNVSFFRMDDEGRVRARIFERGVGETLSSGTGASGAAVAAVLGGATSPVTVELDGGELQVDVESRPGRDAHRVGASPSSRGESRMSSLPSWSARHEAGRATGAHPALPVRAARAEDRRQEGRRRRRDLARHRGPGHADPAERGRGDGACGARPEHPHVPLEQGAAGVPRGRRFYRSRFGVTLDPDTQVMPAIGGKECVFNINFAFLDEGDVALAADPGYPPYTGGPLIAGAAAGADAAGARAGLRAGSVRDP